ncbi:PREDICTED: forkhead box B2 isoform X1 [Prunus dulcis]|uniref:PREDICTED: forkhead box B2 isoform X1 n=1 Tax=Prunus dulcis TaxID=3755 RepID=A0A5E4F415_PRUDU|nr:hypothetical protein L3X38_022405 [Prunus dulcis]VVA22723.1 PREDICTED: forkhead box B2 isoform X1 [Prunus dulcis]
MSHDHHNNHQAPVAYPMKHDGPECPQQPPPCPEPAESHHRKGAGFCTGCCFAMCSCFCDLCCMQWQTY